MPLSERELLGLLRPLPPRPDTRRVIPSVPTPEGASSVSYARFIPAEELRDAKPWTMPSFDQPAQAKSTLPSRTARLEPAQPPREPTPQQWLARIDKAREEGRQQARQTAYEDGYRDGLAALEGFKKRFVDEMGARLGALVDELATQLDESEARTAEAVSATAVLLAQQVLRTELRTHPEQVVAVAREAIQAVLLSATRIVVRVHPDDLELIATGAAEVLQARGAKLVGDASVRRGGCRVDSDAGSVDASIETRWARAAASMGHGQPWQDEPTARGQAGSSVEPVGSGLNEA